MSESVLEECKRPRPLYPQLRARKNASPAAVDAHQRTRLHAAMIEACAARGYAETTVSDIVALAGVSKKTLYKHFESKEACFLSTYDLVVSEAVGRISAAYREGSDGGRDWAAGLCRAFETFAAELVERPKPSRLALVDALAAGPPARDRIERVESVFARMIAQSVAQGRDGLELPPWLVRSLVGGTWFVARNRIVAGQTGAILDGARELDRWILTYCSPRVRSIAAAAPDRSGATARVSAATARVSAAAGADPRTRLMLAAASIAAEGGYAGMTAAQIAERAGVEDGSFTEEFDSARQCFLCSLELMSVRALAAAMHEGRGAPDWPVSVCRVTRAMFRQVAVDRVFARVAFAEASAAGIAGVERRAALLRSFAALLERRAPDGQRPTPLVAEAIVGAVWSLAHRRVAHGRAESLDSLWPHAAYLVLAPVVGRRAAVGAITAERAPARR